MALTGPLLIRKIEGSFDRPCLWVAERLAREGPCMRHAIWSPEADYRRGSRLRHGEEDAAGPVPVMWDRAISSSA